MTAILRLCCDIIVQSRYLVGIGLYDVPKTAAYPFGFRYRLLCLDSVTGARVLMDNHHPKGPHVHLGTRELAYTFVTPEKLVSDFREMVRRRMGIEL